MIIIGTPTEIKSEMIERMPKVDRALKEAREAVPRIKREIDEFQAAALYVLANKYNFEGARFLEIGTAWGYSAAIQALAAPKAQILTLNPHQEELAYARQHLSGFPHVTVSDLHSWTYLEKYDRCDIDFMFVDGDHKRLSLDLPWWKHIVPGGTMLFHDYSPADSRRRCEVVFDILNGWRRVMGRDFDIKIIDDSGVGMVGYVKPEE